MWIFMRKVVLKLILLIVVVIAVVVSVFVGIGYSMYDSAIKDVPLDVKIAEIQEDNNYTKVDDMVDIYKDAVIAVEDHRFYMHKGVDFIAVSRAVYRNIVSGQLIEGGSTITQQLAKNTYFTQSKEITRKVAEFFMCKKYENDCSKDLIFELYVNTSYFGDGYYNVKEASQGYFGKLPSELNSYEATMLAGVPNAPSVYAPTVNFDLASQRQRQVLEKMVQYDYIDGKQMDEILSRTEEYREYFKNK